MIWRETVGERKRLTEENNWLKECDWLSSRDRPYGKVTGWKRLLNTWYRLNETEWETKFKRDWLNEKITGRDTDWKKETNRERQRKWLSDWLSERVIERLTKKETLTGREKLIQKKTERLTGTHLLKKEWMRLAERERQTEKDWLIEILTERERER